MTELWETQNSGTNMSLLPNTIAICTVTENYNDKDAKEKGYISVKIPTLEDKHDIIRQVRVMQPYATGKKGFYFLPEVGDIVVALFLDQGLRRGLVMGSLYSVQEKGHLAEKKNISKEISTKSGLTVSFNDTEKKESLALLTPKKQFLSLDDDKEQIVLLSKDEVFIRLDGKKGETVVQAKDHLTLQCGSASLELKKNGEIVLKGKSVKIDGQDAELTAKNALTLNGQTIKIKGKATTSIEGGTKLDLKSSGIVEAKGAMVKLNG
ncbi:MAG: phage baseplate assembly protein V [Eubacterium sp.]|jgi:uncharacterized protein involved in type VI secretion and phage assembly|nr:phage baseplate assembly protein V [Eubacterium sp.]